MLKKLYSDFDLTPEGWVVFKFTSSYGQVHYKILSYFNERTSWSRPVNIQTDIFVVRNGFRWQNDPSVAIHLDKSREDNMSKHQEVELDYTLTRIREQWENVEKVKLQDVLPNSANS